MSGYNTANLCPICGTKHVVHMGCPLDPDTNGDNGSCCDQIADLAVQLENLITALGGDVALNVTSDTVLIRHTCLADGTAVIAYDTVPAGATDPTLITTIYRPLPAAEGLCTCPE